MSQPPAQSPPFSSERAFVVQFRSEAELTQGHYVGRVEHVISGHAIHFGTLAALLEFMAQVLTTRSSGAHSTAPFPPAGPDPVPIALSPGPPHRKAL